MCLCRALEWFTVLLTVVLLRYQLVVVLGHVPHSLRAAALVGRDLKRGGRTPRLVVVTMEQFAGKFMDKLPRTIICAGPRFGISYIPVAYYSTAWPDWLCM